MGGTSRQSIPWRRKTARFTFHHRIRGALTEGKVPAVDKNVATQFPENATLFDDPKRKKILVHHILSIKMGVEWNEDIPYTDPRNSEIAMENSQDRYRFVLERLMANEPGDYWVNNGGAVAIMAKIIANGVGVSIDKYA